MGFGDGAVGMGFGDEVASLGLQYGAPGMGFGRRAVVHRAMGHRAAGTELHGARSAELGCV